MSGIEAAGLALGMISAIISIVDATIKIYEAVKDEAGLPTNFKKSATKLPLISKLLEDAERYVTAADEATETAFTPTLEDCKAQATQLQELFAKVMPEEGESRWDRYVKAARTIGKGGRVEDLVKGILDDLQLLATSFPEVTTQRTKEQLAKAVEEVTKMEPSLPDGFEQMPTYAHYGSGAQNNITGQHINSGGNQMYGSGQQYIGTNHIVQYHAPPAIDGTDSHGNVYFKVLPVTASGKRSPISTVLISRDKTFVERQDVFRALELQFSHSNCHNRAVLTGLGGVGKSQVAIEYSYRLRERDPDLWVFWVYASTAERFEGAYRSIAATLDLPGADDPKTDVLVLVSRWLSNTDNGRWLMILDNADDIDVFQKTQDGSTKGNSPNLPLSSYIPQSITGSVLVTTRDRSATSWLSTGYTSVIPINLMSPEEADQLLCARIHKGLSTEFDRTELVKELDYLPLAITQAAAYISANALRTNVSKYLVLYRHDEQSQSRLLDKDSGDLRRDPSVPNSVIRTWEISFNQLKRNQPQAAELLSLMAMLDRQGIPEFLLNVQYPNPLDLEDALAPLDEFSLITVEKGGKSFEMHRLIQLATRKWVEQYGNGKRWWSEAIGLVSKAFPNGSYSNWKTCETLSPHALQVLRYVLDSRQSMLDRASLLHNMSWYNWIQGRYEVARAESKESLAIHEQCLQHNDEKILASRGLLASVLSSQGKYADAEAMNRQTLAIWEEVLGKTHPDTLTIMNNLALVLNSQGKYADAEAMNRQTLAIREEVLGKTHPDTLMTMSNLAGVLARQGKYADAEAMNRQTLAIREEVLGKTHPDTLTTMNNLAGVLARQGKYADAEAMNRQTLAIWEEVLGKTHPDTLMTMSNLALVLNKQGKYADAEAMNRQTLAIWEEVLGKTHPDTLTTMSNLALVLARQGKYADAEAMNRQTLQIRGEVLGKTHPDTLTSVYCLAHLLQKKEEYEEALILYQRACTGYQLSLGSEHPTTKACVNHYSVMLNRFK